MGDEQDSPSPLDELPRLYGDPGNRSTSADHAEDDLEMDGSQVSLIPEADAQFGKRARQFVLGPQTLAVMTRIATALEAIDERLSGIAGSSGSKVDTTYVAERLGCTTVWVAEQARSGQIPQNCIVSGTGNGKPWKFYRVKIETWIKSR